MFQESTVTGILFLIAVFINSRTAAIYAILGALLPIPIAILLGVDSESLNAGLMGYNGVLCAMVGMNWGIITLTAPFVLAGNGTAKNRGTKKPVCGYGVKRLVPAK